MANPPTLSLQGVSVMPPVGPFRPAVLETSNGEVEARWYEAAGATGAILWLGDRAGGFDSPADGLFDRLAEAYVGQGVASLRIQYRRPHEPGEVGLDGLVAAYLMRELAIARLVTVGWGIGAVAAIGVAHAFPTVAGVALLAPTDLAGEATKGLARPLLLQHGKADGQASTALSRDLLAHAEGPKRIVYYDGAGHDFATVAPTLEADLRAFLDPTLGVGEPQG